MVSQEEWYSHPVWDDPDEVNGKYVYHFTSIERLASIALTGQLLGSPLKSLNDPQEAHAENPIITSRVETPPEEYTAFVETELGAFHEARDAIRIVSFSSDGNPIGGSEGSFGTDPFKRRNARAYAIAPMWAHYADRHRGVCVVFSKEKLLDSAGSEWRNGYVQYFNGVNEVSLAAGTAHGPNVHKDEPTWRDALDQAVFTKNSHWFYEREFRLMSNTATTIPIAESVGAIILGFDFPSHLLPVLEAVAEHLSVDEVYLAKMFIGHDGVLTALPAMAPAGREELGGRLSAGPPYFDEDVQRIESR